VARARREAGRTQGELAAASGVERTAISKIEHARRGVASPELASIARALGRPVEWFLAGVEPSAPDALRRVRARRRQVLRTAARHGARRVRLFGSVARGEAGPDSDLDLLVEFEPGRTLLDQAGLKIELEELLGVTVDVVTARGLRESIRRRVLAEAVPL
jgi:uncharacterized protein